MKNVILVIFLFLSTICNSQIPAINSILFKSKSAGASSGDAVFVIPGSSTWTVPAGVTSVCIVCIGGGGGGSQSYIYNDEGNQITTSISGGGGGLGYANNITVTAGESLTINVGSAGLGWIPYQNRFPTNGGNSSVVRNSTTLVYGNGGNSNLYNWNSFEFPGNISSEAGGTFSPNGGNGGSSSYSWSGNAGLYTGNGTYDTAGGFNAKGSSLYGSGVAQSYSLYGGGGLGLNDTYSRAFDGVQGAVRILWGTGRSFPNTNVSTSTN